MRLLGVLVLPIWLQLWGSAGAAPPPAVSETESAAMATLSQEVNVTAPFNTRLLNLSRQAQTPMMKWHER